MKTTEITRTAALLFAATLMAAASRAATVETFSFTQNGYLRTDYLHGTFTGAVEPDGLIQLADLSFFTASFTENQGPLSAVDTYSLANLQLFSFMPSTDGPNSTLDIFASFTTGTPGSICVGAAAAFGLCGKSSNAVGEDHLRYSQNPFLFEITSQFAVVQFVPPQPAATPEPASAGLCGLTLASVLAWRALRIKRDRNASSANLPYN
jgi:hypothetical protein